MEIRSGLELFFNFLTAFIKWPSIVAIAAIIAALIVAISPILLIFGIILVTRKKPAIIQSTSKNPKIAEAFGIPPGAAEIFKMFKK